MSESQRVAIVGAGGYTGSELVRLIHGHPRLELAWLGARDNAGRRLGDVLPSVEGIPALGDRVLQPFEADRAKELAAQVDVAFTALPHAASARIGTALLEAGLRVVDLSADFRLRDAAVYGRTYGEHPAPHLLAQAVYGLPELYRDKLRGARLIASPGCYPTSAILPLVPLLEAGLIEADGIVVDSKSGASGGGRAPAPAFHFPESSESVRPYKVAGAHRHVPEIEQELSVAAGRAVQVAFTPHLVPMSRGILTTAYARVRAGVSAADCRRAAERRYAGGLTAVLGEGKLPDTLAVRGSARAQVAYAVDDRVKLVIATCAIDNLAKGASSQAVQALNVALGWPDELGLPEVAVFP
ncbi:MAG TPA: N-acetyl-gamma-glutamyl-phosphate reductase [Polyangiaceae bacterium]|nr:N-acetyl-gamma-glutamyl-phosphate reductase [Polyangiaceae bacterium]